MTEINSAKGEPSSVVDVNLLEKMLEKRQKRISKSDPSLPDKPPVGKNPCIFRLPPRLKSENIKGLPHSQYSPQVVSIGPYWRDNDGLKKEELKWQCLDYSVGDTKKEDFGLFLKRLGSLERKARDCFSENIDRIESNDFLEMMVLDGCFIFQFLRFFGSSNIGIEGSRDHPFGRMDRDRVMFQTICMDLLMLENQIPYFVLEELFEFFWDPSGDTYDAQSLPICAVTTFLQILEIGSFGAEFKYIYYFWRKPEDIFEPDGAKFLHLLDLVRSIFIPTDQPSRSRYRKERFSQENRYRLPEPPPSFFCIKERFLQENWYRPLRTIPRISKLRRAGIKVKTRKKDRFLVVEFVQSLSVIEMPNISLNELMCSFLVNCVAFEQSCNTHSKHFSVYALFLDYLVNTAEDVEYLCEHRVIDNYIENDAAASFINHLGKGLTLDGDDDKFLMLLCSDVDNCYRNRFNRQLTSFKGEYFDKPWLWISGFLALVLLVLTFLQTYYTMHPN